jgi:hypothetical protein
LWKRTPDRGVPAYEREQRKVHRNKDGQSFWGKPHCRDRKKELAEKQNKLGQLKFAITDAERQQIRPLKLIIKNEATEDDTNTFNKYEAIIQSLRLEVTILEKELKNA